MSDPAPGAAERGEFGRIARYFAPLAAGFPGALGLTDDAALVPCAPGQELVVTTDALVEGIHFVGDETPSDLARKALRVNLSDLAAMGADPVGYSLVLALPPRFDDAWVAEFAQGLAQDQQLYGIALIGGDSVATPGPAMLSISALGRVPTGTAVRRGGARPGDEIWVTGTIGDGALGLDCVQGRLAPDEWLIGRYRLPQPRLGLAIRGVASAALDISDGLLADLGHIAEVSGVALEVDAEAIPLSGPARAALTEDPGRLQRIVAGGDDYELALTIPQANSAKLLNAAEMLSLAVTRIGRVVEGRGVRLLGADGRDITPVRRGYRHYDGDGA